MYLVIEFFVLIAITHLWAWAIVMRRLEPKAPEASGSVRVCARRGQQWPDVSTWRPRTSVAYNLMELLATMASTPTRMWSGVRSASSLPSPVVICLWSDLFLILVLMFLSNKVLNTISNPKKIFRISLSWISTRDVQNGV